MGKLDEYLERAKDLAEDAKEGAKDVFGEVMSKAKEDYSLADKEKCLSWCVTNDPELIKTVPSIKWMEMKKRLTTVDGRIVDKETGLFVDGVEIEEKPEEFKVKARDN